MQTVQAFLRLLTCLVRSRCTTFDDCVIRLLLLPFHCYLSAYSPFLSSFITVAKWLGTGRNAAQPAKSPVCHVRILSAYHALYSFPSTNCFVLGPWPHPILFLRCISKLIPLLPWFVTGSHIKCFVGISFTYACFGLQSNFLRLNLNEPSPRGQASLL